MSGLQNAIIASSTTWN